MAFHLKGIGDPETGKNEIIPSFDARISHFIAGIQHCVVRGEFHNFDRVIIDRGVRIRGGLCQAHGYFAINDEDFQINFVLPSSIQRTMIFAEINLAVTPHVFTIRASQMTTSVNPPNLTQDNLRLNPSGVFQIPLWFVTINPNGTITAADHRPFADRIMNATNSTNVLANGTIAGTVTAVTQAQTNNSTNVSTTAYTRTAIANLRSEILDSFRQIPLLTGTWSHNVTNSTGNTTFNLANSINFNTDFIYLSVSCVLSGYERFVVHKFRPIQNGVLCSFETTSSGIGASSIWYRLVPISATQMRLEWNNLHNSSMTGWNFRGNFVINYMGVSRWER